jgi:hypothetical protein
MMKWNYMSVYWIAIWFGALFLGPELFWLWKDPKNTLSYQVWHLEGLDFAHLFSLGTWTFGHYVVFVMMIWLTLHFGFGLFR